MRAGTAGWALSRAQVRGAEVPVPLQARFTPMPWCPQGIPGLEAGAVPRGCSCARQGQQGCWWLCCAGTSQSQGWKGDQGNELWEVGALLVLVTLRRCRELMTAPSACNLPRGAK